MDHRLGSGGLGTTKKEGKKGFTEGNDGSDGTLDLRPESGNLRPESGKPDLPRISGFHGWERKTGMSALRRGAGSWTEDRGNVARKGGRAKTEDWIYHGWRMARMG